MGMYHIGVVKALFEEGLLPQVVSGTSAGSLIAALLCSLSNDELPQLFKPPFCGLGTYVDVPLWRKFVHLLTKGVFMDMNQWEKYVRERLGDITFKEAYEKTGRILNISVASTKRFEVPTLLNYITAPNVVIYSAVCASCALPLVFKPVNLLAKDREGKISFYHSPDIKWRDGSIGADLPMRRLAELFAVNHFIVSQVNPHVAPFLRHTETKRSGVRSTLLYFLKSELRHRTKQLAELGLIRGFLSTIEPVVLQTYHGDITIVPPFVWKNYGYLFSKPDDSFISLCIDIGCRNTWTRIPLIKNHLAIEQCLENCCERLKRIVYHDNIDRKNYKRVFRLRKSALK